MKKIIYSIAKKSISSILKRIIYLIVLVVVANIAFGADPKWVNNPNDCPATDAGNFSGQDCSPDQICGESGDDIAQCFDMSTLNAPSSSVLSTTDQDDGSFDGGYILNCYVASDSASPFCDNDGDFFCDRNSTCQTTQRRQTNCTASVFGQSTCGPCRNGFFNCYGDINCESTSSSDCDGSINNHYTTATCDDQDAGGTCVCDTNFYECDGSETDANGCEINTGASCNTGGTYADDECIGSSGNCTATGNNRDCDDSDSDGIQLTCGTSGNGCEIELTVTANNSNSIYQTCDTFACTATFNDCNGAGTGADADGCEIEDGGACSVGVLSGTYSGCSGSAGNCVVSTSYFETGTEAAYSTDDALLWGSQYGSGYLINMTNGSELMFGVNNSGCVVFPDGTTQCSGATDTNMSGLVPYENAAQNVNLSDKNITTTGTGFFSFLGSLVNRIITLFVQDINLNGTMSGNGSINISGNIETSGNVTADYFLGNGSQLTGLTESQITDLQTYAINNTAGWILNFTEIFSDDWTNVTITESQISNLVHIVNGTNINVLDINASSATIHGDLNVTGRLDVGTLNISGVTFSQGDLDVDKSLRVNGGANISGDLGVSGNIYGEIPDAWKLANFTSAYGTEYAATGFKIVNLTNYFGDSGFNGSVLRVGNMSNILESTWNWASNETLVLDNGTILRTLNLSDISLYVNQTSNASLYLRIADVADTSDLEIANVSMLDNGTVLRTGNISDILESAWDWDNASLVLDNGSIIRTGNLSLIFLERNSSLWNNSGTDVILNDINANVGIGTTSPTQKLDVNGSVNISGIYYGNGSGLTDIGADSLSAGSVNTTHIVDGTITDADIDDSTNLTLGQKIVFALGGFIQNIISGQIDVNGTLNISDSLIVGNDLNVTDDVIVGGDLNVTGNVTATYFFGDGSQLTGISSGIWTNVSGTATYDGDVNVTGNVTADYFIGDGSELTRVGGHFVGRSTSSYTGSLSAGGYTGYEAGNYICDSNITGSHLCNFAEIAYTIGTRNLSTISGWTGEAWISTGPAKYSPANLPVNDCNGFTHGSAGTYLGNWWSFSTSTGGVGKTGNCGNTVRLACCI